MPKYLFLFIPFALTFIFNNTEEKYIIAWLGSFYILGLSIYTCKYKLKEDINFFSPIILAQALFWGYTALTSIFYFLDQKGYEFFEKVNLFENTEEIKLLAAAQTYIVFGHACYITGYYIIKTKKQAPKYRLNFKNNTYFNLSILAITIGLALKITPFAQISNYLSLFSTLCAVRYFGVALKRKLHIPIASVYLFIIIIVGFFSGMKENTIYPLIFTNSSDSLDTDMVGPP